MNWELMKILSRLRYVVECKIAVSMSGGARNIENNKDLMSESHVKGLTVRSRHDSFEGHKEAM